MAKLDETSLHEICESVLPEAWVNETARTVGAVKRERKVKITMFVWSLVLGFGDRSTGPRTIATFRRAYKRMASVTLAPSAFYNRFTKGLVRLLQLCVDRLISEVSETKAELRGMLHGFSDLIVTDSTVVRLCSILQHTFPGTRKNHSPASVKMHLVLSAAEGGARSVKITNGRKADGPAFKIGKWVAGKLLLFDLGYFKYWVFARIDENGGFFISRFKDGLNALIVGENAQHGIPSLVGQGLLETLHLFKTDTIDLQVAITFKRRSYCGHQRKEQKIFRLVGKFNPETSTYRLYLTNVPSERLNASEVAQAYRFRWSIELFFKEIKSYYHLEDLNTANEAIVRSLLLVALITAILARKIRGAAQRSLPKNSTRRIPPLRFAAVFSSVADKILDFIAHRLAAKPFEIIATLAYLLDESIDPNVSRKLNTTGVLT